MVNGTKKTKQLILIRHGQSQWNLENRFTGWVDVDLTDQGKAEALAGGKAIAAEGLEIAKCFVSPLKRAKETAALVEQGYGKSFDKIETPEVIERFYGGLTGLNKAETMQEYGESQVHIWRRSYDIPPPALEVADERHPSHNPLFKSFPFKLPATESLKDVVERVVPFYNNILQPSLQVGKAVLVAAHGNSIRALVKEIKQLDEEQIQAVEIPTGSPLLLEFSEDGTFISDRRVTGESVAA